MNDTSNKSFAASPGSVVEIAANIRAGNTTPSDVVQGYLERIAAVDSAVNAWVSVDDAGALSEASEMTREAARGEYRGPLHGVPVAIKDICDVAGWPTRCNSATRANAGLATADADIVAALRNAGAIVLGKTHTTEFAYYDPSPARNPHNTDHTLAGRAVVRVQLSALEWFRPLLVLRRWPRSIALPPIAGCPHSSLRPAA